MIVSIGYTMRTFLIRTITVISVVFTIVNQIAGITPAVRVADYSKRYDSSLPNLIAKRFTEPIME